MLSLVRQKRAALFPLLLVLVAMAILGTGAYMLGSGIGSEITGFDAYIGGCNGSIKPGDGSKTWTLSNDLTCPDSYFGINITASDVVFDCQGKSITGTTGSYGILVNTTSNNVSVKNCKITGFNTGIKIDATGTNKVNINNNIITSGTGISIGSSNSNIKIWNNNFHDGGVTGNVAATNVCDDAGKSGNFYVSNISKENIKSTCGLVNITDVAGVVLKNQKFDNIDQLRINWTPQSTSTYQDITYNVLSKDNQTYVFSSVIENDGMTPDLYLDLNTVTILNSKITVKVIPFDNLYNGTSNETYDFEVSNDHDFDGASNLSLIILQDNGYFDVWDCNDSNSSIHQPEYRENDTSTDSLGGNGTTFCYDTVDDDCDLLTDWLDDGCGHGFDIGTFDNDMYVNGSITKLTETPAAFISNEFGSVQYDAATDLTGVDISSIFTITKNLISVNILATNGNRFNKQAKVNFKQLTNYTKVPIVLVDGYPCPSGLCTDYNPLPTASSFAGVLSFTALHFSTFTTAANSMLETFTQNDSRASSFMSDAPKIMEPHHRLRFFANYSKYIDGSPVNDKTGGYPEVTNGGACNITLFLPNGSIIQKANKELLSYDFNNNVLNPWSESSSYLNSSLEYTDDIDKYSMKLQMVDDACVSNDIDCYGINSTSVITNTSQLNFNITFRARSDVNGRNIHLNLTEVGSENENNDQSWSLSTNWTVYSISKQFTGNGVPAQMIFYLDNSVPGNHTVYIDDVTVYVNGTDEMEYDDFYGVYVLESSAEDFPAASDYYRYRINCSSTIYEPLGFMEYFRVIPDTTPPEKPILYPQILLHPSNLTDGVDWTYVAGYFGESDITYSIVALHGFWSYQFMGTGSYSGIDSEYKGDNIVVNFDSTKGQNVTFVAWNAVIQSALNRFSYVEFSNHNRSYFDRYQILRANKTGDDIRIEFYQPLAEDIPMGTVMRLYTTPHPPGYFIMNVSLFGGSNRITAWGVDREGNEGNATSDWINAPYPETAPPAPVLWPVPEAVRNDTNFTIIGYLNESTFNLNMSVNILQDDYFFYFWNWTFESSTLHRETVVTQSRPVGSDYFFINPLDYNEIEATVGWNNLWVEFSNHNRTYWFRYNVTNHTKNPGEDARIYIYPNLSASLAGAVTEAAFYNSVHKQGWFNISVDISDLKDGLNELYLVPFRGSTEGYQSESNYVHKDGISPWFNISSVQNYSYSNTPEITFSVYDDFKVDTSKLIVMINHTSESHVYTIDNMTCFNLFLNGSYYECTFQPNLTYNGNHTFNFTVSDMAGWSNFTTHLMKINVSKADIISVDDGDDITSDLWLYFNWTTNGGVLDRYEFALGTVPYPESGYDSIKSWQSSCTALGNCQQDWVNFTHNATSTNATTLKMKTGTVYYLTVRAVDSRGEYGKYGTSDGVLFIDPTPPVCVGGNCVTTQHWVNSRNSLSASWDFEDNESDIIGYMYSIGTSQYPAPGFESVVARTEISSDSVLRDDLNLSENGTYYFNVKARNGNIIINYNGTWSTWVSSPEVRIDTRPPYGGFIFYNSTNYTTTNYVTIQYNTGQDWPNTSGISNASLEYGRSELINGICQPIYDLDSFLPLVTGATWIDFNVSSGFCYVFRLNVWDNAGNAEQFFMPNETLEYVKIDYVAPTNITAVYDDGFYTFDRKQLHAWWTASTDTGSGFDHYLWEVYADNTANPNDCNVTTSTFSCGARIFEGNTTATEITLTPISLEHNYKYYFVVTPFDKADNFGGRTWSNGILYVDNAPPGQIYVYTINEDNQSSSPYLTEHSDGKINITAYGDLDGYHDIENCVLMSQDIDYTETARSDMLVANCTISDVLSNETSFSDELTDYIVTNITKINCINFTNYSGGSPTQETFSWALACRDKWWNTQSYANNALIWFTVDWPDPPKFLVSFLDSEDASDIYSDDNLYCRADFYDTDDEQNMANATISWYSGTVLIKKITTSLTNTGYEQEPGKYIYYVADTLTANYTYRLNNITCLVNVTDNESIWSNVSNSVVINNNVPDQEFELNLPENGDLLNGFVNFSWIGPYDDIDDDFINLELQIDNETSFNWSNNIQVSFESVSRLDADGVQIPGVQRNPDVFETKIVYEDTRSGSNDIYVYDKATGLETAVVTSTSNELNPQIYRSFVAYERNNGATSDVYMYSISSSITKLVVSGIEPYSMDFFSDRVVYRKSSAIYSKEFMNYSSDIYLDEERLLFNASNAINISIYGNDVVWTNSSDSQIWIYDISNRSAFATGLDGIGRMWGYFLLNENSTGIHVRDLRNGSASVSSFSGTQGTMSDGLLVYRNTSGNITVVDLLGPSSSTIGIHQGMDPDIHNDLLAFDDGQDVFYAFRNEYMPGRYLFEYNAFYPYVIFWINSSLSQDGVYYWRLQACDNSFVNNSCVFADYGSNDYASFTIDNTPPEISIVSPGNESIVAGQFRLYAKIDDNRGYSAVTYANYSISYSNGTRKYSGTLVQSGNVWMTSSVLDFQDVNVSNFTVLVYARDSLYNLNSASSMFTVDNDTAWFIFGTGSEEIITDVTAFINSVNSTFTAFNVLTSNIRISGPLPTTTSRSSRSQVNTSVTTHIYPDPISVVTWPDGKYVAQFNGTNPDGPNSQNRTFYVDRNAPFWYNASPTTIFASQNIVLSINWTDITIREINVTYDNWNKSNITSIKENMTLSGGRYVSSSIDIRSYINSSFYWTSTARDGLDRVNTTTLLSVFVESNAPDFEGTIPMIYVKEDSYNSSALLPNISSYFSDVNDEDSVWGYLDNLTFSATDNSSSVAIDVNSTTGKIQNITATGDFNGNVTVYFNATDSYGKMNHSNAVTLVVISVNDAPVISAVPAVYTSEDNLTTIEYSLSATDVDGDTLSWTLPDYNIAVFNLTQYDLAAGKFNFTLKADQFGVYNITFKVNDTTVQTKLNATVDIASVNDAPVVGNFTAPPIGARKKGTFPVSWIAASDKANENQALTYYLSYSTDGTTWNQLVDYATLQQNTSYSWNSSILFIDSEVNITLRLNVSDGMDTSQHVYEGNFTIDNLGPQITVVYPTIPYMIISGGNGSVNVTTHESATCSFVPNVSSVGVTTFSSGTTHTVILTNLINDVSYRVNVSCTDLPDTINANSTAIVFTAKSSGIQIVNVRAVPSVLIDGNKVNLTLEVFSSTPWDTLDLRINNSGSDVHTFTTADFTDMINSTNSFTRNLTAISTTNFGRYDVFITLLNNTNADILTNYHASNVFTVYPAINQTLNME